MKNFIEIIIALCEIIRNNRERSFVYFSQFIPLATSCKTTIQYHNQEIGIIQSSNLIPISPVILVCGYVFIKSDRILSSEQIYESTSTDSQTRNSSFPTRILCNIFSVGRQLCSGKWETPTCHLLFLYSVITQMCLFTIGVHLSNPFFHNLSSQKDQEHKLQFVF